MRVILLVVAFFLFALGTVVAFGWLGIEHTPDTLTNVLGLGMGGAAFLALSFLPAPPNYFK